MLPGVTVDPRVGELDRLPHSEGEPLRRGVGVGGPLGGEMTVDQVGRHLAGQLTRDRATHAIGHHEQRASRPDLVFADFGQQARVAGAQIGDEERVLVMVPGAPAIGLSEYGGENGSHSEDPFQ